MKEKFKTNFHAICILSIFFILLSSANVFAKTEHLYVSDILVVTLREGPAKSYRTVKTVKSGEKLVVLAEENKFVKVRTKGGIEGWVPRQYTLKSPPKAVVIKSLNDEIERLNLSNQNLSKKADKLAIQLKERKQSLKELKQDLSSVQNEGQSSIVALTNELDTLQKKYDELFKNSKEAINIRKERDSMKSQYDSQNARIEALEQANSKLSTRRNMYWFLSGAGVLLIGWIIGKISSGRKNRPSLSL